jgi:hypothetical protein
MIVPELPRGGAMAGSQLPGVRPDSLRDKPLDPLDGDTYWVSASKQKNARIVNGSWMN